MPYYKKLLGQQCYLSPCSREDGERWAEWLNDLAVALPLGDEAYTSIGLAQAQEMADHIIRQQDHVFTIVDLATDAPIGRCLLFNINAVNRHGMFGIFIGDKSFWGRGYGQEATRLTLDYAFNLLNLNSVMLGVMAFNQRAIHAYEKAGFKVIGRRRQARIIGAQKFDVIFMDILAEEFTGSVLQPLLPPEPAL